jgi:quercetin dioxygenase-like cupin family protein
MPFIEIEKLNSKEIVKGYRAQAIHTGTMTMMYWTVEKGASIPMHQHMHEQVAHVLEGKFELTLDQVTRVLEPGIVAVIPPFISHGGRAITACKLLDVFHPEREDYKTFLTEEN